MFTAPTAASSLATPSFLPGKSGNSPGDSATASLPGQIVGNPLAMQPAIEWEIRSPSELLNDDFLSHQWP